MPVSVAMQVALVRGVAQAWQTTADARLGLFNTSFDPEAWRSSTGDSTPAVWKHLTDGLSCHHAWLGFLLETWQACPFVFALRRLRARVHHALLLAARAASVWRQLCKGLAH
jgi:hypothetical protein